MLEFLGRVRSRKLRVGWVRSALTISPKATLCELEQNIPFFKTLIAIFRKTVMTSSVGGDFKCEWRLVKLYRA